MASAIRVLHIADVINRYDFIDNVLRFCDRERFQMSAATFTGASNIQSPTYADVKLHVLGVRGRGSYPGAVANLATTLRRERIDVVHTHHFDPMVIGVTAAVLTGRPAIIGRHYSDALHRLRERWKRKAYLRIEAFFHRCATKIIVPSAAVYDLLTQVQGVDARKVVTIPYGFDLTKYVPSRDGSAHARRRFAPDHQALIGCVGRLHREKGHIYLLRACKTLLITHPHFRVLLVGDGPEKPALEAAAREMGLDGHVIFAGWRTDVVDVLSAVDIVVQPSLAETFSQSLIEALALGKPVVMSDVSGARDVIQHGRHGFLTPPADPESIARAVRILLDNPPLARRLGEAGRARVMETYDIRSIIRRYEGYYEMVHAASRAA